jgi:hypothetical protein
MIQHPASEQELVEQICAAMWRLRGMRDALDQLIDWGDGSLSLERYGRERRFGRSDRLDRDRWFVVKVQLAFAACAEALRELAPSRRAIPVPDWKVAHASKKKRSRR